MWTGVDGVEWSGCPLDCYDYQSTCGAKNESVCSFDQSGTSGFCIPFANSINTASRKEKHVFVILVLDDHVLRNADPMYMLWL